MHFTSGGYARKNGFQFELKYSSWLDGQSQEKPWSLYISRKDPETGLREGTYTERSQRFQTEEEAHAFCERVAEGEISLTSLREQEERAYLTHEKAILDTAKEEAASFLSQMTQLNVDPVVAPRVFHAFAGLSEEARKLACDKEFLAQHGFSRPETPVEPAKETLGDWLSHNKRSIDVQLLDRNNNDHFLSAVCYLSPEEINANHMDYTAREKWLMSLPVSHVADNMGCPIAVLKTELTSDQVNFLLGIPQTETPEWSELSMRALYADADFGARLAFLRDGTPFEVPFDGTCMDVSAPEQRQALYQLLQDHDQVFITRFPGITDDYYAYAVEKNSKGQVLTSESAISIQFTEPGKGLTNSLLGKIEWAQFVNKRDSKDLSHGPMPVITPQREVHGK